jgi:hypothetical protein
MDKEYANKLVDNLIEIGFQNDDGFTSLEDTKFDYFSRYSDSQLDEIYEADANARDVIDKIRKIRQAVWK